ncbi:hypothetical protein RvY_03291-2 [Ramazzottius varieornatus]|uniref:Uncharacterized protein n=1 Tax=Ramazzottius varieornatus TaxID=947166 RepID=A0A1D1UWY5_RAMVA|nr:hypothetical protein RvY_03291-2 [Ramazzottius varieornatus]
MHMLTPSSSTHMEYRAKSCLQTRRPTKFPVSVILFVLPVGDASWPCACKETDHNRRPANCFVGKVLLIYVVDNGIIITVRSGRSAYSVAMSRPAVVTEENSNNMEM